MKISAFINVKNAIEGQYPLLPSIQSHLAFADEVIVIDGGSHDGTPELIGKVFPEVTMYSMPWGDNWTWETFAEHWNKGYELCTGDFVCAGECDHVFHEKEAAKIRPALERHGAGNEVCNVDKLVSSTIYKWKSKAKMGIFLNKGEFNNLGYGLDRNGGPAQDLANPIEITNPEGGFGIPEGIMLGTGRNLGVYMHNYDKTFKTAEQIIKDRLTCNKAWNNSCLVKLGICAPWTEGDVLADVIARMKARYETSQYEYTEAEEHPTWMHSMVAGIEEYQLGYNLFGAV